MPTRVIREGWLESERIAQLDAAQERFFLRLCLRADDYGRYTANPLLLKAALFPLCESVRSTDIPHWLAACEAAGLVRCYQVDGKTYVEIPRFGQRTRAMTSKYPPPPDHVGQMTVICQTDARQPRTETETEAESESEGGAGGLPPLASPRADSSPSMKPPAKPKRARAPLLTDEAWLASLANDEAYIGVNVQLEHAKATVWCREHHKPLTRSRFVNWLNRAERILTPHRQEVRRQLVDNPPDRWRERLEAEYPGNQINEQKKGWDQVPQEIRAKLWPQRYHNGSALNHAA